MARKIAITLRKGGSGKTTTAVNLAAALHLLGKRALLVDLDPQANATLAVGIDPTGLPKNINHLFTTIDTTPQEVIVTTAFGLPLLPSHPDLAMTEGGMKATQVGVLRGILEPLEHASPHDVGVSRKVGASGADVGTAPAETAECGSSRADSRPFPVRSPHRPGAFQPKHQLCGGPPMIWRGVTAGSRHASS